MTNLDGNKGMERGVQETDNIIPPILRTRKIMENINEMRSRHKLEIEKLQEYCNHPTSQWLDYMWAPGHFDGQRLVCNFCGKTLDSK